MTLNAHFIELLMLFLAKSAGGMASEEVTLQLEKSKCIPVLLYGLVAAL